MTSHGKRLVNNIRYGTNVEPEIQIIQSIHYTYIYTQHYKYSVIRRLPVRFSAVPKNDVVSLGKALHPICLRGNVPVLTVSR